MAVYFVNTLLRTSDFAKVSDRYSSIQSIWRGKENKKITVKKIGGMLFAPSDPEQVAKLHSVATWQGLALIDAEHLPAGLAPINRVRKIIGVGEMVILEWAMFNRIDVYWIGGTFFTLQAAAKPLAPPKRFV